MSVKMVVIFLILNFFNFSYSLDIISDIAKLSECVEPPLECPNDNITFWLYTKATQDKPYELSVKDPDTIDNAPWVGKNVCTKILIHGYTGHKDFAPNTEIRPAYYKCCDCNIISVDYNPIAREPCYIQAANNTELVGKCTAQLVDLMVSKGFDLSLIHPIGFSLGGQVVGFLANYIQCGRFSRITALDPALPLFAAKPNDKKTDASDADTVDVLHTDALERGKLEASGTVDFYANGGSSQPGCPDTKGESRSSCNHARAPKFYAESIITEVGFYGKKCSSWLTYTIGLCEITGNEDDVTLFGEYVSNNVTGTYFFKTNAQSPFAKGREGN